MLPLNSIFPAQLTDIEYGINYRIQLMCIEQKTELLALYRTELCAHICHIKPITLSAIPDLYTMMFIFVYHECHVNTCNVWRKVPFQQIPMCTATHLYESYHLTITHHTKCVISIIQNVLSLPLFVITKKH